MKLKFYT
jgi:hypothetical protein